MAIPTNLKRSIVFLLLPIMSTTPPASAKGALVYPPWDKGHPRDGNPHTTIRSALDATGPGEWVQIMPGEYEHETPAPYVEDVHITEANTRLRADPGAIIEGTIRVDAPGVELTWLTIFGDEACIVLGPNAKDCRIAHCRLVVRTEGGIAVDVVGPGAGGVTIANTMIYTPGGQHPDTDRRGLKHNWKRFERAGIGVRIAAAAGNEGAYMHHNRIAGYTTGVRIGEAGSDALPLKAHLWKNKITANTTGIRLHGGECLIEDNDVMRSTADGVIVHGLGNRLVGNRLFDNAAWAVQTKDGSLVNNVIAGNQGGAVRVLGAAQLLHNTFYGNGGAAVATEASDAPAVVFMNNLIDHGGDLFGGASASLNRHHNVYANGAKPDELGAGSRIGLVRWRDEPRRDYRPAADSIAVDAAVPVDRLHRDAGNGARRIGSLSDAGAFEVGPDAPAGRAWWVAPDGDDAGGTGSQEQPFRSVTRAVRDAGADDRIYMKAGVYDDGNEGEAGDGEKTRTTTIKCAGAAGHPIRIGPEPGVVCAVDLVTSFVPRQPIQLAPATNGKVVVLNATWHMIDTTHTVIEGIEFRDSPSRVISMGDRASHNTVRRCLFLNCPRSYANAKGWGVGIVGSGIEASDILIEHNVFDRRPNIDYHHRETDVINPGQASWSKRWVFRHNRVAGFEKLQLGVGGGGRYPPGYHRVVHNEFFECNRAVHIKTSDNVFAHNYVHHMVPGYTNQTVGIMNRSGYRNHYEGNRVEGCSYAGILLLSRDHVVRNNVFDECDTGVLVAHREFGAQQAENIDVFHNTVVNCARGVHVDPLCSARVYNNVFYRSPGVFKQPPIVPAVVADSAGIYPREKTSWALFNRIKYRIEAVLRSDYNVYFNCEPPYLRDFEGGHHELHADPLFVDAANRDYRLQPQSPARGAGRDLDVGHDIDGRPRPAKQPDCGAFQFLGGVGGTGIEP